MAVDMIMTMTGMAARPAAGTADRRVADRRVADRPVVARHRGLGFTDRAVPDSRRAAPWARLPPPMVPAARPPRATRNRVEALI
jgi:hypothetical protein